MRVLNFAIIAFCLSFVACKKSTSFCSIKEFGAIGDYKTNNTLAIQSAIDACHKSGGGEVLVEGGDYVTGTILLKDNVTLKIEENASLIGSENPEDYRNIDSFVDATGQVRGKCLIGAIDAKNIGLVGTGVIDGRGKIFESKTLREKLMNKGYEKNTINKLVANRPFLIRFVRSENIKMDGLLLRQSAAWTCHFFQCNAINVNRLEIYGHANKNNDGIDIDSSHDVQITNCYINTGDDAICLKTTSPLPTYNVKVSDCTLKSEWGAIKLGTESMGDMYNIDIRRCKVNYTKGGGIKILSVDGANITDVTIDSINMTNVDMPIFIRLGERLRTYRDAPKREVGSINNVNILNITGSSADLDGSRVSPPAGVFITGTPNYKVGKINLKNIYITLPGGGLAEHKNINVIEDETKYPEFSLFGILPSYGLMARHVEDLNLENYKFIITRPDERHDILTLDVDNFNKK
ncbi:glycosyl hydrolase family 28 protein [Algibacter sp. 2305UL17-15]|uniref:glycoside hydrolase family 28 protein n=1 Tax=Algibacter sp. 2305UL17-15 TaxID=3231268 RepID=UPI00345A6F23